MTRAQRDAQRFGAGDVPVKILDVDIVIAGGLHFRKLQALALGAHVVDVHELGVVLVVAAGDDVRQGVGRVERGEARDAELQRAAVQGNVIVRGRVLERAGVDDVVDAAALEQGEGVVALADAVDGHDVDAEARNGSGGLCGRVEREVQVVELLGQRHDLAEVVCVHAHEHARGGRPGAGRRHARPRSAP